MAHIRLTVNGTTLMDGEPGAWIEASLKDITDSIKRGTPPEPWRKPLMILMADVMPAGKAAEFTVTTNSDGWTLDVRHR